MIGKSGLLLLVVLLLTALSYGCSKETAEQKVDSVPDIEPVTLTVAMIQNFTEEFQELVVKPTKKRYPHITLQQTIMTAQNYLDKLIAAGTVPDIVVLPSYDIIQLVNLQLDFNMEPLMKEHQMNIGRFVPEGLEAIKVLTQKENLVALPYNIGYGGMYYNKDIFDRFGVSYPRDGMTWEEIRELAKKVTRNEGGIQYRGFEPGVLSRPASQLSLPYIEAKTNKAVVNTEPWKQLFEMLKSIYDIPGNNEILTGGRAIKAFQKDKTIAMLLADNQLRMFHDSSDLNWDMVTYPTFKEAPGKGINMVLKLFAITAQSQHKEEAFQVISTVLSDEVQLAMVRSGRPSSLADPKFKQEFAKDLHLDGKNIQAFLKLTPAKSIAPTKQITIAEDLMQEAMAAVVKDGKDINTALREAEENINKAIQGNN
jgi:multiple sugar transport system substrate-binding protein